MSKNAPDLFHNRSTTQEFLVSHTDDTIDDGTPQDPGTGHDSPLAASSDDFGDMLDRRRLEAAIDDQLTGALNLCVLAIHIVPPSTTESVNEHPTPFGTDILQALINHQHAQNGIWGRIGQGRYACVFTDLTVVDGRHMAETLMEAVDDADKKRLTIGLAAYPTINYSRRQTLDNAEKALDHGAFFGPGTITPFDAVSLNISGDRRYQTGDIDGAIAEFKKGLLIDPTNANLHNSLGVCYGVQQQYDTALAAFENADWLSPDDVMAIYNKGYVLMLMDENEQALACLLEANRREPDIFEVVFHIGQIHMQLDRADRARVYLEAATRANNRSGPAFRNLGTCLNKLGMTKEAIQAYKSAIKMNPADAQSLATLGGLYTNRGESLDVAMVLCEQSVHLEPQNGFFRHQLAMVYLNQEKLADALASFETAVQLGHDSHHQVAETRNRLLAAKAS